jgi:hypothetical protein
MTDDDKALDKIIRASMPLDFERKETLSDDKALVERLRWSDGWFFENPWDHVVYASDDPLEAADRIEAQAAEIERLREAGDKLNFFAGHAEYCCNGLWTDPVACDCGYTNAWKAWRVALGEGND